MARQGGAPAAATAVVVVVVAVLTCAMGVAVADPQQHNLNWRPDANYTVWAAKQHFYKDDWLALYVSWETNGPLFYVFRWTEGQYDVMVVNEAAYNTCSAENPLDGWSRGDRWAVQLNQTKRWYFICSKGYCFNGMKLSILVQKPPPPPKAQPQNLKSGSPKDSGNLIILRAALAVAAVWGVVLRLLC
ncbi:hypothetical protein QJS10_CPB17g00684 [Acorus calamus]|uniref:Phytocyanin domain-containing protein n=1 Tax=Acorus calamus TaxID=4465 RepID=A0AAV9CQB6_ACOCL|nr:hypothetical protein QJS10_CPB17g00684 [Acorus calamus]